ncbi:hypothetical protein Pint_04182 [Pistacia integerrima]|uniref:Uncharacterized protein n=1 Tax=Pistacia integerrima TaxID=434235 RepID=A0ACC0Z4D5_9ROSI|nr:hypothetical protein Pint_04182 [Pistacia integerrima]
MGGKNGCFTGILAEKWCPETKSVNFSWGESTITLEDLLIVGYSALGSRVFCPVETDELNELEEKLNQARSELNKSTSKRALHRTRIALAPTVLASIYKDLSSLKEKIVALTKFDNWGNEDNELAVTVRSPFQLVQTWAWERFLHLRPELNLIKMGGRRFAWWHEQFIVVENVRKVIDSAKDDFDWRPYVKPVTNWNSPKFYREKEMLISVDPNLSEKLLSFSHCLRVSKLVGFECIEQYPLHRVAMQFGMDQDLPPCVARINEIPFIAWNYYSKPICYDLYIPCQLNEGDVTSQYSEWWNQSISCLQGASEFSFTGTKKIMEMAKGKKEADT